MPLKKCPLGRKSPAVIAKDRQRLVETEEQRQLNFQGNKTGIEQIKMTVKSRERESART